jgi:uncharacterized protein DUF998
MTRRTRLTALGGVIGPATFVTAWAVLGARAKHYDPTRDPISRLAAVGAPSRPEMTAAFVAFSAGLSLYALAAREHLSPRVAALAAANALATLGVAAFPLEGFGGSAGHAIAAGTGYVTLAAMPIVSGRRGGWAWSLAIAAALAASAAGTDRTGLFQRTGLTLGDAWIVGTALWMLTRQETP